MFFALHHPYVLQVFTARICHNGWFVLNICCSYVGVLGPSSKHNTRFLADGLGTRSCRYCHGNTTARRRKGIYEHVFMVRWSISQKTQCFVKIIKILWRKSLFWRTVELCQYRHQGDMLQLAHNCDNENRQCAENQCV